MVVGETVQSSKLVLKEFWRLDHKETVSLLYRKMIDFCILTLYPETLLLMFLSFFFLLIFCIDKNIIWDQRQFYIFISNLYDFSCLISLVNSPVQCWKGLLKEDILALLLMLVGKLVFHNVKCGIAIRLFENIHQVEEVLCS